MEITLEMLMTVAEPKVNFSGTEVARAILDELWT